MTTNECDFDVDDWENMIIPDLLERERQIIEERKMMEEADAILTEELFSDKAKEPKESKDCILQEHNNFLPVKLIKKVKPESIKYLLQDKQKQISQKIRQNKEEQKRKKEIYGEPELDEYDELYGYIEDKYIV